MDEPYQILVSHWICCMSWLKLFRWSLVICENHCDLIHSADVPLLHLPTLISTIPPHNPLSTIGFKSMQFRFTLYNRFQTLLAYNPICPHVCTGGNLLWKSGQQLSHSFLASRPYPGRRKNAAYRWFRQMLSLYANFFGMNACLTIQEIIRQIRIISWIIGVKRGKYGERVYE